jgi:hypothetical protein
MPGTGQQASDGIIASRRLSTTMARFHSCSVSVRRQSGALLPNQPIALMGRGRLRCRSSNPSSYRWPGKRQNSPLEVSRRANSVKEDRTTCATAVVGTFNGRFPRNQPFFRNGQEVGTQVARRHDCPAALIAKRERRRRAGGGSEMRPPPEPMRSGINQFLAKFSAQFNQSQVFIVLAGLFIKDIRDLSVRYSHHFVWPVLSAHAGHTLFS